MAVTTVSRDPATVSLFPPNEDRIMARTKGGDAPNKMQLVRDAIAALGPKAKPKELQAKIQEAGGVAMSTAMISSYKSHLKNAKKGKVTSRPAAAPKVAPATAKPATSIADDVVLIRKLIARLGAKEMNALVEVPA